ncbi:SitI3 family protein [Nocardia sp. NPDC006044]|uniref:SitI3 family protein n=1 Tax=Nocardia sp. NPDC006044 TaxID=3364306 RepID=UPI0036B36337
MAVEFSFEIATAEPTTKIWAWAAAVGSMAPGWLDVGAKIPSDRDPIWIDFGIRSTVWVQFALSGDHIAEQHNTMTRIVSDLLRRTTGDAILHHQYDDIWLIRRVGSLVVSNRGDAWTPLRLAALPEPYSRAPLHFSED